MSSTDGKGTSAAIDEKSSFVMENGVWLYRDSDKEFQRSEELVRQRRHARALAKVESAKDSAPIPQENIL